VGSWFDTLFGDWWQAFATLRGGLGWDWTTGLWLGAGLALLVLGRMVGAYGSRLPEFLPRPAAVYAVGAFLGLAGLAVLIRPLGGLPGVPMVLAMVGGLAAVAGLASLVLLGRGLTTLDVLPAVRGLSRENRELVRASSDCGARLERAERAERDLGRRNEELTWEVAQLREALADKDRALGEERLRDDLTGLFNRTHFVNRLREEFERGQRNERLPQPLFIGLQGLERLSERDQEWVLAKAGQVIKETLRMGDLGARYGERAFLVVASDAPPSGVVRFAMRLHKALKRGLRKGPDNRALPVRCAYVLVDLDLELREFSDFLEVCNHVLLRVPHQAPDRLVRLSGQSRQPGTLASHP
jgi:diguanylate cyclase (GGDEF)-like protein